MQTFLLGVLLVQAVPSGNASYTASIDVQHTLLLIGGRIMNYPAMGEYGMNILSLGPGESLRLTISENSGSTWELGDPSIGLGALFSARRARRSGLRRNRTQYYWHLKRSVHPPRWPTHSLPI